MIKNIDRIKKRFERLIKENKIKKPKSYKEKFFRKKAEISLRLSKELIENPEYFDWSINAAYYSMFYNAISLLSHIGKDLDDINESVHLLTYQALVYFFHIKEKRIASEYLEEFKANMEESDLRLKNLAKRKSEEILSSYRNAKKARGEFTYELGKTAKLNSAQTAIRRANSFDMLADKLLSD